MGLYQAKISSDTKKDNLKTNSKDSNDKSSDEGGMKQPKSRMSNKERAKNARERKKKYYEDIEK